MMRAQGAPRKVYTRNGVTHVCFQGIYFRAPKASRIDPEREVSKIEVLDKSGGKHRVGVTQRVAGKNVTETWHEGSVPVQGRRKKQGKRQASISA